MTPRAGTPSRTATTARHRPRPYRAAGHRTRPYGADPAAVRARTTTAHHERQYP
ncbi:hypothetical protein ACFV7Q_06145 [Streptomyces sp. NPDC059851]|uniref:hypothetical protein n=1 Tax=Streptomyces sp. NPDC059851 TaxID=3346971 RepID=UPI003645F9EF